MEKVIIRAYKVDNGNWQKLNTFCKKPEIEVIRKSISRCYNNKQILFIYDEEG